MSLAADLAAALDPAVTFRDAFGSEPLTWQEGYLRETRPTVVLKGRQVGASMSAAGLAIHTVRYRPDVNAVIVSPSLKQSTEITTRARAGLRSLGERLVQDSAAVLRLANGSRIISLPGTPRSVRGWTARLLIIDEAAYVDPETFAAAKPIVATGERLVVQSTPADESGDFHDIVTGDAPGWARFTVRSDQVPTISDAFLASERDALGPDVYAREYECKFGKAGATLFTADRLAALVPPGGLVRHVGVVIADRGAAIVTVERGDDDSLLVTGIERLPFDLGQVADRVYDLDDPDARYVIDSDGLGSALWAVLGHEKDRNWTLYAGRGLERQALVDVLLVAVEEDRFHFAAGLAEQEPMNKALLGYRRQVKDDGLIGSELVVALLLALIAPRRRGRVVVM